MPEMMNQTPAILVGIVLLFLVIQFCAILWIGVRLGRIERALGGRNGGAGEVGSEAPETEVSAGSAFEEFLDEDPARRKLPKKEQFAAYREWRKQMGLNWSKS